MTLQIQLPDDLRLQLAARALEGGFGTVEQYAEAVLRASAVPRVGDEELEQLLGARAEDLRPGIEFTPEFADEFREQVRLRRATDGVRR